MVGGQVERLTDLREAKMQQGLITEEIVNGRPKSFWREAGKKGAKARKEKLARKQRNIDNQVAAYIPKALKERVLALAEERRNSVSATIEYIIRWYFDFQDDAGRNRDLIDLEDNEWKRLEDENATLKKYIKLLERENESLHERRD